MLLVACAGEARAQDAFEIQVYDAETAAPGQAGLENHINAGADAVGHFTLEPHVGLASWCEAGAYLQTAITSDRFDYAGVKLRWKLRWPQRLRGFGVGINFEVSSVPKKF